MLQIVDEEEFINRVVLCKSYTEDSETRPLLVFLYLDQFW